MKSFVATLVFVLSFSAFARTQKVMTITNDIDTNSVSISLNDDGEQFKSIYQIETTASGDVVKEATYNLDQLFKGPTVQVKSGRDVVKIRFNRNFDPTYGGTFVLDYLTSGITGSRKSVELDLRKNGSKWEVTMNNKVASKLFVVAKRALGKVIGISQIQTK